MRQERPNVLYLHSHDTGRYVQPYGHPVPTPAYQRLAQEGVLFRQNFCLGPTCSPSRAALLTGQTPHSCGQLGLAHRGFELQHPERHLAWTLRQHGYSTTLIGVQHVTRDPARTGYEQIQTEERKVAGVTPRVLTFLEQYARGSQRAGRGAAGRGAEDPSSWTPASRRRTAPSTPQTPH